jgi:hypothetical protein
METVNGVSQWNDLRLSIAGAAELMFTTSLDGGATILTLGPESVTTTEGEYIG